MSQTRISTLPNGLRVVTRDMPGLHSAAIGIWVNAGCRDERAEQIAWATVNKEDGGGNKSGSGRGQPDTHESAKKGGERGGKAPSTRRACSSCRRRPARIRAGGILCAYATNTMRT